MITYKDKNIINILLAASAMGLSLFWVFIGEEISEFLFNEDYKNQLYLFISGSIFSIAIYAFYIFIKTVLSYAEFIVEKEDLPLMLYKSVLEEDSEGIFFKDREGKYRIMNSIARSVLGLENKQVNGKKDMDLHHSIMAHKIELEDRKVLLNGKIVEWESSIKTMHGTDYYISKKIPCRDKQGKIIGITGLCKNISKLRQIQGLNVALEERYRNLFNKLPYPVLVLDAISMMPFTFSDSMNKLLGYDEVEFSKLRLSVHVADETVDEFREKISELIKKGGGEFDLKLKTANKEHIDVSGYAQDVVIEDKQYLHMLLHDVTEIKKSNTELIGSELKYRSLFEYASDAIIVVDMKTFRINDANEVAIKFLGYARDDLTLMTLFDLDDSSDQRYTQEKLNDLEIYNHVLYENEIRNLKGERYHVEVNAHKVNYGENEVYQYVLRNISNRKRTERALQQSEQRYRQMFESNKAIKLVINPDLNCIEDANPAAAEFYGYELDELRGMNLSVINILSESKLKRLISQTKEQKLGFYSCPHKLKNGDIRFVEVRDGIMEIENSTLLYSIIHDVTVSKQAEEQLVLASKMFDYSTDAVMITDKDNIIVSVNRAFEEITGYRQSEVVAKGPSVILAGRDDNLISKKLIEMIESDGQWQGEIWHRLKGGVTRPLDATINIVKNDQGDIINHVILMSPTRKNKIENKSSSTSVVNYTGLTGLANKSLFVDRLQNAIERNQRSDGKLAVLLIDFENFSQVNKDHGYDAGDLILKAIAKRLKFNVRESDTVAHFAKDDFAVLLEDLSDVPQTGIVAQKIISTLSESYQVDNEEIVLKVSIGISVSPDDGMEVDDLLKTAARALFNAEQKKVSNFELASEVFNENAHAWLQTEENMHQALKNNEFVVHYLPQIKTDGDFSIEAVEALVRWQREGKGILLPLQFLPNAERSGFISAIAYQAIDVALKQFKSWTKENLNINKLWINVCQSQLESDFSSFLIDKCDEYGLPYNRIALDITETHFLNSGVDKLAIVRELYEKGFYICVDDFGSVSASLVCLFHAPANGLKVDNELTAKITDHKEAYELVKGIVTLADQLNIDVIVEGVETQEQYEKLIDAGCKHMQGHYFSQAVEAKELPNVVKKFSH